MQVMLQVCPTTCLNFDAQFKQHIDLCEAAAQMLMSMSSMHWHTKQAHFGGHRGGSYV